MTHEVLDFLWRVTLTISLSLCFVLALRLPVRRWLGAQAAYGLWLLIPGAMLAMLLPAPVDPLLAALRIAPGVIVNMPGIAPAAANGAMRFDVQLSLLAEWVAGAFVLAVLLIRQQRCYLRSLGRLAANGDGTLRSSRDTGSPALIGALHPRIVLPRDFDSRFDARERELVLAHERAHLVRGDAQVNALVALLRCVQWFNPLVHYAAACLRIDQEIACDALVIARFPEARRCYADAMLKAQRVGEARQELRLPAGCHWPSGHPLKERILMLKFPVPTARRRRLAHAVVVALLFGVGYACWAAQPGTVSSAQPSSANPPVAHTDVPSMAGKKLTPSGEKPVTADNLATSIQPGEIQNMAPSENISYRKMLAPQYPPDAVKAMMGAHVILKVLVDVNGNAKSIDAEKIELVGEPSASADGSTPNKEAFKEIFFEAASEAAKSWKFNPGLKDGKPFEGYALVPIDFSLRK